MSKIQYRIGIPDFYVWGVLEKHKNKDLFIKYVKGYIARQHNEMKVISIKRSKLTGKYYAICEKG